MALLAVVPVMANPPKTNPNPENFNASRRVIPFVVFLLIFIISSPLVACSLSGLVVNDERTETQTEKINAIALRLSPAASPTPGQYRSWPASAAADTP